MSDRQAGAVGDSVHQVLQVRENMGVRLVAMLRYEVAVHDYVKLAVGPGGELERRDCVPGPAEGFSCHPGSAEGVASILAVEYLQFQFLVSRHFPPLRWLECRGIIGRRVGVVN